MSTMFMGSFVIRLLVSSTPVRLCSPSGVVRSRRNILRRLKRTKQKRAAMKVKIPSHHFQSLQGTRSGVHEEVMFRAFLPRSCVSFSSSSPFDEIEDHVRVTSEVSVR